MKITPANESLFKEDAPVVKQYFLSFAELLANKFEVPAGVFYNHLGVFELFLLSRKDGADLSALEIAIATLVDWFDTLDASLAREVFMLADEACKDANDSFFSMINSDPHLREEYSFKENMDKLFDTINRVVEFMIVREGFLIAAFQKKSGDPRQKMSTHLLLDCCKSFLGDGNNLSVTDENLIGIPLNQWRNIAAHKSYKCFDGKIEASYGQKDVKVVTLSRDELERACMEIYKLRVGVKLITGLALTVIATKNEDFIEGAEFSARSFLHDMNYILAHHDIQLKSFERLQELVLEGKRVEVPDGFSIFDVRFISEEEDGNHLAGRVARIAEVLALIFGGHNTLPEKEKVLLHFSRSPDSGFHMIYTYD